MSNKTNKSLFFVTQFYPPDHAPTGQLISQLADYLGRQGQRVRLFTSQPAYAFHQDTAPQREQQGHTSIRRTRINRLWPKRIRGKLVNGLIFCLRTLLDLFVHRQQIGLLLLTTEPAFLTVLGYLVKKLLGIPYVCLVYDLYPDVAVQLKVLPPHSPIAKFWDRMNQRTWENAECLIAISSTMRDRILAKHPSLASKVKVIHNWSDPDWIQPLDKQVNWFAQQHQLQDRFTVLYSGNMGRCHDLDTILQAAQLLQHEPIQFVFIGGGAKFPLCQKRVQEWQLDNCLFLPYQDTEVVPFSLTACDLSLVSIAEGMEGTVVPSKLYSILASGRAVAAICEPHSYLRQILSTAKCGKAFENGDAHSLAKFIRQLAGDPNLTEQLGLAGREYMENNFTLAQIGRQYAEVLDRPKRVPVRSWAWSVSHPNRPIGQQLIQAGFLSVEQVQELLIEQAARAQHIRFGELAVSKGWITEETISQMLTFVQQA